MEQEYKFNPEVLLRPDQQAHLAATCATEGYKVLHILFRSLVDKYMIKLAAIPSDQADKILAGHMVMKTATELYTELTDRINVEIVGYIASHGDDTPSDPTESLLDIGELASTYDDLENDFTDFEEGQI